MPPDEAKAELYDAQSFSVEDIETETPEIEPETTPEPEEFDIEVEGAEKEVETETKESDSLRREIADLKSQILQLSSRREEPKIEPKKDDKPEKLTRGQIAKILTEHKDDPEVLLNVIDYISEQKATEIKDSTVKDMNHQRWASELSGVANRVIADDEDGFLMANPKVATELEGMAANLGLQDHPVGRLAAYAIFRLTNAAKAKSKEEPSEADKKPSTKRVLDKTRVSEKASKGFGLTQIQLDTAKKFGVKPETYAKFVRRS